jgi:hypothetical protein
MATMKKLTLLLFLAPGSLLAQQATVATGGEATGPGGSASYSVGQAAYTTVAGPTASVAQGVQQPWEISIITGMEEEATDLQLLAYPNPTTDGVVLHLGDADATGLHYQLHDAAGAMVANGNIPSDRQPIDLHGQASGTYILSITRQGLVVRSFRIVKH